MKKLLFILILLLPLSLLADEKMKCKRIKSNIDNTPWSHILRCENSEVVCYLIKDLGAGAGSCKFKELR
jgi:hypothetical protein